MCNVYDSSGEYVYEWIHITERREQMTHSEYRLLLEKDRNSAVRALYDEYVNYVYTIVFNRLRCCGTREDVGDCVIEVFYEVFSSYDESAASSEDIKGFIGTVAYRRAANMYRSLCRKNRCVQLSDELSAAIPSDEDITDNAENNERRHMLLDLISSLGEPDSTIIMQKFFYGQKAADIAEMVQLSPMMIRVRSSRALKKLRKLLDDKDITI